jgi:pre-mRNA-processing factor 19
LMRYTKSKFLPAANASYAWTGSKTDRSRLSKSRKKRPVPKQWAKPDDIASFGTTAQTPLPVPQASSIGIDPESDYAAISGLKGDIAIYSTTADRLERSLQAGENVTDTLWTDRKVIVSTTKGSVKVLENGAEKASFSEHAGAATGLAVHPSNKLIASVGLDKSFIFYDLEELQPAARIYTDSCRLLASLCEEHF